MRARLSFGKEDRARLPNRAALPGREDSTRGPGDGEVRQRATATSPNSKCSKEGANFPLNSFTHSVREHSAQTGDPLRE